jgi:hypothetical protein
MDDHQEEMPMADGNADIHMWTELQRGECAVKEWEECCYLMLYTSC